MRIIDADKLKETIHINHYPLRGSINSVDNGMWTIGIDQAIDEQPTIDAKPVVHGHWVKPGGYVCGDYEFVCSVCGDCRWEGLGLPNRAHYCQCCGAKMDEDNEGEKGAI